jgi:hypothetical protein
MMHNYGDMMGLHNKSHPYVGFDWSDNHLGHEDGPVARKKFGAWSGKVRRDVPIRHRETFSTIIQPPYSSTKG